MSHCPDTPDKARYTIEAKAAAALTRIQNDPQTVVVPVRYYYCGSCNGFHLTSKPNDNTSTVSLDVKIRIALCGGK